MRFTGVCICLLSGAAALIFETLWFPLAALSLGNSVWAVTLVLAAFMGGLALGSSLIAGYSRRVGRPARLYAIIELLIGFGGLGIVLVLPMTQDWLAPLFRGVREMPWAVNGLRLGIAFVLLLLPSTAMGMTFPLLVKMFDRGESVFGVLLGRCYAWNTLGAVGGTVAAELVLIKALGMRGTGLVAVAMNLGAAGMAMVRFDGGRPREGSMEETRLVTASATCSSRGDQGEASLPWRLLLAAFLAGMALLALEVVWFRFMQLFFNGTSKVFALMLAVVLSGIAGGGWLGARITARFPSAGLWLRDAPLVAGLLVVLTYAGFALCREVLSSSSVTLSLALQATLLMGPVTVVSGVFFTVLGHEIEKGVRETGRSAGLLTLANTVGAMSGSFLGGFVLLPGLGMERSFLAMALLYGVIAWVLPGAGRGWRGWARLPTTHPSRKPTTEKGGLRTASKLVSWGIFGLGLIMFPFGMMSKTYFAAIDRKLPGAIRLVASEGLTETALYYEHHSQGKPFYHRLVTHGYSMSSTDPRSKRYMKLFVYLPVALHPDPKSALLICFGVGSTAKALTDTKALRSIDIVDTSENVLGLSSVVFPERDRNPLHDPRVRKHIEDGRFFLQTSEKRFDLITAEPPPPKIAGVVSLYSQEFFELARERLAEGGMLTYWLPVYQMQEEEAKSIIKAFLNAFPDTTLWEGGGLNWMLLGTRNAVGPGTEAAFVRQWGDPVVGPEMGSLGLERPEQLGALFLADASYLRELTESSLPLRDLFPQRLSTDLADRSPDAPFYRSMMEAEGAEGHFSESGWVARIWPSGTKGKVAEAFGIERMINYSLYPAYRPSLEVVYQDLHKVLTGTDLETLPLWLLGSSPQELAIAAELGAGVAALGNAYREETAYHLAAGATARREYGEAARICEADLLSAFSLEQGRNRRLHLFALCMAGELERAKAALRELEQSGHEEEEDLARWLRLRFRLQ